MLACEKNSTAACSNVITADFTGVPVDLNEPEDDHEDDEVAARVASEQAMVESYPNPFNPSTTIRFTLAEAGAVRLEVFDVLGRRVALLVDASLEAGVHEAVFEAGALPSGVYLYRMQAGASVAMGRMTLFR